MTAENSTVFYMHHFIRAKELIAYLALMDHCFCKEPTAPALSCQMCLAVVMAHAMTEIEIAFRAQAVLA